MKSFRLKILLGAALFGLACTTKVSEWVLLNSAPNRYQLVYYFNGTVSETVKAKNSELENRLKPGNVVFRQMQKEGISKPYYALYYNNRLFSEYADFNSVSRLEISPARTKIAAELMAGKLCVMVYLKTDSPEKDERGLQAIRKTLAASPFEKIITVVELDRTSVEEKHFISLLLNVEDDLKTISEPMLFGVFGRFRTLEPLVGKGILEENIKLMIDFFTADCSCVIKDDLPGISILYNGDWENPAPALVNSILDANPQLQHH
jgi:hypothetical protein